MGVSPGLELLAQLVALHAVAAVDDLDVLDRLLALGSGQVRGARDGRVEALPGRAYDPLALGHRLALLGALLADRLREVVGQPLGADVVDEVDRPRAVGLPLADGQRAHRAVRARDGALVGVAGRGDQAEQRPAISASDSPPARNSRAFAAAAVLSR